MEEFVDYYDLLGLSPRAEDELIKKAYRIKSKGAHPDTGGSQQAFLLLTEAYETLIDPVKRKRYDLLYYHIQDLKYEYVKQATQKENSNDDNKKETQYAGSLNEKVDFQNWRKILAYGGSTFLILGILAKLFNNLPDDLFSTFVDSSSSTENPTQYELAERIYIDDETYMKFIKDRISTALKTDKAEENISNEENSSSNISDVNISVDEPSLYNDYLNKIEELASTLQPEIVVWETGSDSEILAFSEKEYQLWDDLLNEIYGVLKENLSNEEFISLRELQREWILERERLSKVASQDFRGGTWEAPIYISTQANETKLRCFWLVTSY